MCVWRQLHSAYPLPASYMVSWAKYRVNLTWLTFHCLVTLSPSFKHDVEASSEDGAATQDGGLRMAAV